MTVEALQIPAYRTFVVHVARLQRLSPSFLRVTFTGADLDRVRPQRLGPADQGAPPARRGGASATARPARTGTPSGAPCPADRQNPIRTYTVRAARPEQRRDRRRLRAARRDRPGVGLGGAGRRRRRGRPSSARTPGSPARPAASSGTRRPTPPACWSPVTRPPSRPSARSSSPCRPGSRRASCSRSRRPATSSPWRSPPGSRSRWLPRWTADAAVPARRGVLLTEAVVRAVQDLPAARRPGTGGRPRGRRRRHRDPVGGAGGRLPRDLRAVRLARRGGRRR